MNPAHEFFVLKENDPGSLTSFCKLEKKTLSAHGSLVICLSGDGLAPMIPWQVLAMHTACFSLEPSSTIRSLRMNLRGGCTEFCRLCSQYVHIK